MLSLASASYAFNPAQAFITRVAEVSIVGLDERAIRKQIANLNPVRTVEKVVTRASQRLCMVANTPDAKPKIVGDYGFDPLSLGKDDNFAFMREAEIKHGRLAMLAAVAWPLQEILHPIIVDTLYDVAGVTVPDVLVASNGASPSTLNGGLLQPEVLPSLALFTLGCAFLEEQDLAARKGLGCEWNEYPNSFGVFGRQPGNFGFDPLNFYRPLNAADRVAVQERELLNGRVAMLAVAAYVGTEFVGQTSVVRATPELFEPLFLWPGFRAFIDASFGMASMDGSIDGIAY